MTEERKMGNMDGMHKQGEMKFDPTRPEVLDIVIASLMRVDGGYARAFEVAFNAAVALAGMADVNSADDETLGEFLEECLAEARENSLAINLMVLKRAEEARAAMNDRLDGKRDADKQRSQK